MQLIPAKTLAGFYAGELRYRFAYCPELIRRQETSGRLEGPAHGHDQGAKALLRDAVAGHVVHAHMNEIASVRESLSHALHVWPVAISQYLGNVLRQNRIRLEPCGDLREIEQKRVANV